MFSLPPLKNKGLLKLEEVNNSHMYVPIVCSWTSKVPVVTLWHFDIHIFRAYSTQAKYLEFVLYRCTELHRRHKEIHVSSGVVVLVPITNIFVPLISDTPALCVNTRFIVCVCASSYSGVCLIKRSHFNRKRTRREINQAFQWMIPTSSVTKDVLRRDTSVFPNNHVFQS